MSVDLFAFLVAAWLTGMIPLVAWEALTHPRPCSERFFIYWLWPLWSVLVWRGRLLLAVLAILHREIDARAILSGSD